MPVPRLRRNGTLPLGVHRVSLRAVRIRSVHPDVRVVGHVLRARSLAGQEGTIGGETMIRNRRQLDQTKKEIARLRDRLKGLRKKSGSAKLIALQAGSLKKALGQLGEQVEMYEEALRGRISRVHLERLLGPTGQHGQPKIGTAIFLLRTAKEITQADLAKRLGTKREAIARWERDDYGAYTLESLERIFEALGCRLGIRVTSIAG